MSSKTVKLYRSWSVFKHVLFYTILFQQYTFLLPIGMCCYANMGVRVLFIRNPWTVNFHFYFTIILPDYSQFFPCPKVFFVLFYCHQKFSPSNFPYFKSQFSQPHILVFTRLFLFQSNNVPLIRALSVYQILRHKN